MVHGKPHFSHCGSIKDNSRLRHGHGVPSSVPTQNRQNKKSGREEGFGGSGGYRPEFHKFLSDFEFSGDPQTLWDALDKDA